MILLGWEIGTGKRVEIPETGHLAWFGQTQLSGKTTALEAISYRGHLKCVAFITKQGEGSFLTGQLIPPYFSEPTNDEEQPLWRWVKSILEASQQRKMNFEESWIIRACEDPRQAKTLLDVHENIKSLLGGQGDYIEKGRGKKKKREWKYSRKPVSGMNAGIYTSLKAYFDIVMPQLARLPYTKRLELHPGLNVMNLQEYAMETQALVIRSVMEWVYRHEKNVRIIVPEAQDFVPQGKNSPVKMACETLVRKAGANRNFMWLDSQDMAAVDKIMLRACSIVGIGVQTEGHEIDRSLASLFTPTLKAVDIARLKIGEFFVRTSEARVAKCYVQPAWMDSELHAQAIAKGEESVAGARQMLSAFKRKREQVSGSRGQGKPHQLLQTQIQELPDGEETETSPEKSDGESVSKGNRGDAARRGDGRIDSGSRTSTELRHLDETVSQTEKRESKEKTKNLNEETSDHEKPGRLDHGTEGLDDSSETHRDTGKGARGVVTGTETQTGDDEKMWREKHETLAAEHQTLIEAHDALAAEVRRLRESSGARVSVEHGVSIPADRAPHAGENGGHGLSLTVPQLDYIFKYVAAKAAKTPGVIQLLTAVPEMRVKVERQTVEMDDSTIIGKLARLLHDGYFKQPKNGPTVQKELKRRGCDQPTTNLYKPLKRLTEMGFLTLEPDGFQEVPEMKVQVTGGTG